MLASTRRKSHEPRLCACGCGEFTPKDKKSPGYLLFVRGHRYPSIGPPPLCKCGCGSNVSKRGRVWNIWIKGHSKGWKSPRTEEQKTAQSIRVKEFFANNPNPRLGTKCPKGALAKKGSKNPAFGKYKSMATQWKGGRTDSNGYTAILDRSHPRAHRSGYVYEHILVMEEYLGRYIDRKEVIHHINGIKKDNRIVNLWKCNSSTHRIAHESAFRLVIKMYASGLVKFDRKKGEYYLADRAP